MTNEMNGKLIDHITWLLSGEHGPSEELLRSKDGKQLVLSVTYHGDRDEHWVLQMQGNVELQRFNCKNLASIVWQ